MGKKTTSREGEKRIKIDILKVQDGEEERQRGTKET